MARCIMVLKLVSSFQVPPVVPSTTRQNSLALREDGRTQPHHISEPKTSQLPNDHLLGRRRLLRLDRNVALFSSGGNNHIEDDEEYEEEEISWEDDLSKLLNSRGDMKSTTGKGGERRRKRDRIKEWMAMGFSASAASTASSMVQPIRLEDGSVAKRQTDPPRKPTQAKFDKLFDGMPSLNEILGGSGLTPSETPGSRGAFQGDDDNEEKVT